MAHITYKDLARIRRSQIGKKIVFCSGTFDLIHAGHAIFFEDCKKLGDILVAAVGVDSSIKEIKGRHRPILNQHLRLKMVDSLKPVDYAFLGRKHHPHVLDFLHVVFSRLKPDIYAINDDAFGIDFRKKLAKKYGVKLRILKRMCPPKFNKISTTNIIEKIKRMSHEV